MDESGQDNGLNHWVMDGYGCIKNLRSIEVACTILEEMPKCLGFVKNTLPHVFSYREKKSLEEGISGVTMTDPRGHISLHVYPARRLVCLDIFSSKALHLELIIDLMRGYFGFQSHGSQSFTRGIPGR
ncbi:MAG: S-adenosylmethionine decarboxylase [bacterium]|nr:S-adenosylmethionine decarboxylase [bacterium]